MVKLQRADPSTTQLFNVTTNHPFIHFQNGTYELIINHIKTLQFVCRFQAACRGKIATQNVLH